MSRDRSLGRFYLKNVDETFKGRMQQLKQQMLAKSETKPFVVISGAGPAGLIRAIQSTHNGNPTKVLEKRPQNAPGRSNTVALMGASIDILKYWGIYPYLIENKLIYPLGEPGYICVRLTDLEQAMKAVLHELTPEPIIEYNSKIVDIVNSNNKACLIIESSTRRREIPKVDIFVNAEGARSSTNDLFLINRIEVLPPVPIIVAMCRDDRPQVIDLDSFFIYVGKSFAQTAITTYYHTIFLFQYIFSEDFRTQIAAALILPTPGQNYVGCAFSKEKNAELQDLKGEEYQAFAEHWINLAICAANLLSLLSWLEGGTYFHSGHHLPIDEFYTAHASADYAEICAGEFNNTNTKVLLTGDASATVDPSTGLGCNTAIRSSDDFLDFIEDYEKPAKKIFWKNIILKLLHE